MKKKTLDELHFVGQKLVMDLHKSNTGPVPIGRTAEGAICLLKITKGTYVQYNSTWEVEVVEVHEKKLIVQLLECKMSAAANQFELERKLQATFGKPKMKKQKVKRTYQYDRKG